MNLISIIEEAEKEFDKIYNENGFILTEREIKFHNRQTILELVEGIEKWAEENKVNWVVHELYADVKSGDYIHLKSFLSLLQPLKDKLKQ